MSAKASKKFIAWNVNSLRRCLEKGALHEFLRKEKPDIFCMGETKLNGTPKDMEFLATVDAEFSEWPYKYYNFTKARKGYSGTAIWCKEKPVTVVYDMDHLEHDKEGRVITVEFHKFFVVHVYTPNAGQKLARVNYRTQEWDPIFRSYIVALGKKKPVICAGDFNAANEDIDIHHPERHHNSAGFTDAERDNFRRLLDEADLVDSFRQKNPKEVKYTYWSYLFNARKYNAGWRIDYWLVPKKFIKKIKAAEVHDDVLGSDHAPVSVVVSI